MNISKLITLFIILNIFIININCQISQYTAYFVVKDDCYTDAGCNIIDPQYWNNTDGYNNPTKTLFNIINVPIPKGNNQITLNFNKQFNMNELVINFQTVSGTNTINFLESIIVNESIKFTNTEIVITGKTTTLMSSQIQLNSTTISVKNNATISTINTAITNIINIDSESSISLYDYSSLSGELIVINGNLLLSDNSILASTNLQLSNGLVTSINSLVKVGETITISNGWVYTFLGTVQTPNLEITSTFHTKITLGGVNTQIENLELSKQAIITTTPNSNINITNASLNGNLTVVSQSSIRFSPESIITINGLITLNGNSNSYFSNMIFPIGSIITNKENGYSNITIEKGRVEFLNEDSLTIGGQIKLNENTTISTNGQFILELCFYNDGGLVIVNNLLACLNADYYQSEEGELQLIKGSKTYIYQLYNYGLISVQGNNVILQANLLNYGVFEIQPDCNVQVNGYIDLFEESVLNIAGIAANTELPALNVKDIITLNGTLVFNITAPLENTNSIYYLIQSNIELDGNFTEFIGESFLERYSYQFSFEKTVSSGSYPGSLEIQFLFENNQPKHLNRGWIALGIIAPLVVIAIFAFIVYKYKKNRQYREYKSLSNDNDHIFNNNNSGDL